MTESGPLCSACLNTIRYARGETNPATGRGTCARCRRSRLLAPAADGTMQCAVCREVGECACRRCGSVMPAGYGKRCETCYWAEVLERRLAQNLALFADETKANLFKAYSKWLRERRGPKVAALRLNRDVSFFAEVPFHGHQVDVEALVLQMVNRGRDHLVLYYLRERFPIDPTMRLVAKNERQIKRFLADQPDLQPYYEHMQSRRNLSERSKRMYLCAARGLLESLKGSDVTLPDVVQFLREKPGQRASLSPYLRFLGLAGQTATASQNSERRAARKRLLLMIAGATESGDWIVDGLQWFHGLTHAQARLAMNRSSVFQHEGEIRLQDGTLTYVLPERPESA